MPAPEVCAGDDCVAERTLDTQLNWAETVDQASRLAEQQGKLVFLIHVSGNFEIPEYT